MKMRHGLVFSLVFGLVLALLSGCSKMTSEEAGVYLTVAKKQGRSGGVPEKKTKYRMSTGTGFFITSDGVFITNNHVIDKAKSIAVYYGNDFVEAKLLWADAANDLAVLKVPLTTRPAPVAASFTGKRGEEVFTLGYPISDIQGKEQKASFGRINAQSGVLDDMRYAQIDVPIHPGNSGGPLFNNSGEVIGVITLTLSAELIKAGIVPQNIGYAVKVDYLWPLINQAGVKPARKTGLKAANMSSLVSAVEKSVVQVYTIR